MHNPNNAPYSPHTYVPGWETHAEQEILIQETEGVPADGLIVEIGAEFGMSASLFCKYADAKVRIISIDLFPGTLLAMHCDNLQRARLGGRSKQLQGDSAAIGRTWSFGDIDLLFIDGDHTYPGVKRDILAWMQHVKVGGVALFHDCACPTNKSPHHLHHEVTRAVDEWHSANPGWLEGPSVDSIRVFRRNF